MSVQSTNHIFMIEPADFYDNPQTKETNSYQVREDSKEHTDIQAKALQEFRTYRDMLIEHGVQVTTVKGRAGTPDDIFPNWMSTHPTGEMVIYPMMYENRQKERREDIIVDVRKRYRDVIDFSTLEQDGKALESTSSVNLDHINKIAYMARSPRSDEVLARTWCDMMGFTLVPFDTEHNGMAVYHSDVVLWIGTNIVGVCSECIKTPGIVDDLKKYRDVVEFTNDQMAAFAGNSLELVGAEGKKMLVMAQSAYDSLRDDQKQFIGKHYKDVITPSLPTIQKYGGGSARCMILELF
jgi:hypothetical protein